MDDGRFKHWTYRRIFFRIFFCCVHFVVPPCWTIIWRCNNYNDSLDKDFYIVIELNQFIKSRSRSRSCGNSCEISTSTAITLSTSSTTEKRTQIKSIAIQIRINFPIKPNRFVRTQSLQLNHLINYSAFASDSTLQINGHLNRYIQSGKRGKQNKRFAHAFYYHHHHYHHLRHHRFLFFHKSNWMVFGYHQTLCQRI